MIHFRRGYDEQESTEVMERKQADTYPRYVSGLVGSKRRLNQGLLMLNWV
jgi:hypothetical protein